MLLTVHFFISSKYTEGLVPDSERPGFNIAGDAYKGNIQARLVVVEFSDFQCPSCQRHALEIFPELDKQFIATGQVMWVFKHLSLKIHPYATAAECGGDQNQFWAMHHLLYEKTGQLEQGQYRYRVGETGTTTQSGYA